MSFDDETCLQEFNGETSIGNIQPFKDLNQSSIFQSAHKIYSEDQFISNKYSEISLVNQIEDRCIGNSLPNLMIKCTNLIKKKRNSFSKSFGSPELIYSFK